MRGPFILFLAIGIGLGALIAGGLLGLPILFEETGIHVGTQSGQTGKHVEIQSDQTEKQVEPRWVSMLLRTPWFWIVYGLLYTTVILFIWMNRNSPNVEIKAPESLQGPLVVLLLVFGGTLTTLGFLGLFDYKFVRAAQRAPSIVVAIENVSALIGASFLFLLSIWYTVDELMKPSDEPSNVLGGIIFTLLTGVSVVSWLVHIS